MMNDRDILINNGDEKSQQIDGECSIVISQNTLVFLCLKIGLEISTRGQLPRRWAPTFILVTPMLLSVEY